VFNVVQSVFGAAFGIDHRGEAYFFRKWRRDADSIMPPIVESQDATASYFHPRKEFFLRDYDCVFGIGNLAYNDGTGIKSAAVGIIDRTTLRQLDRVSVDVAQRQLSSSDVIIPPSVFPPAFSNQLKTANAVAGLRSFVADEKTLFDELNVSSLTPIDQVFLTQRSRLLISKTAAFYSSFSLFGVSAKIGTNIGTSMAPLYQLFRISTPEYPSGFQSAVEMTAARTWFYRRFPRYKETFTLKGLGVNMSKVYFTNETHGQIGAGKRYRPLQLRYNLAKHQTEMVAIDITE
jgi:hypothetical protein